MSRMVKALPEIMVQDLRANFAATGDANVRTMDHRCNAGAGVE